MKLVKYSLAAIVTMGALSSASASSLEDAIKGVDITGGMRYRVDIEKSNDVWWQNKTREEHHFDGYITLSVPIAENLVSVIKASYYANDWAQDSSAGDAVFEITNAYFQYTLNDFVFKAGKMVLGTPWTNNDPFYRTQRGNGLSMSYSGFEGWTFIASHFFNTNFRYQMVSQNGAILEHVMDFEEMNSRDLTALGVVGSMGAVNARLWVSKLQSVYTHMIFAEVSTKLGGFNARAQINQTRMEDSYLDARNAYELSQGYPNGFMEKSGVFWGVEAGYDFDNFGFKVGYTQNSKKQPLYALTNESDLINSGRYLNEDYYNVDSLSGAKTWFVSADARFGKYSFEAGYINQKSHYEFDGPENRLNKSREYFIGAGYAYSKSFDLDVLYENVEHKFNDIDEKRKLSRLRVEATYRF